MKILCCIGILLLWKHSFSQDTCRPKYDLQVKYLSVDSLRIAYVEKGKGQPVIFIHGLGGNSSHWSKSVKQLSNKFRCIAIDLPGYGYSDKNYSLNEKDQLQFFADKIISFINKMKLKKVVLAGHSMGGQIAMIAAIQHPDKISKLVLVAPAGLEIFTDAEAKIMINATPPTLFEKQNETVIRYNYKQNFFEQPKDAEGLISDRLRFNACPDFIFYTQTVSNSIKGMLNHPVKNEMSKIKQPVLIVFGANDALIPNKIFHPSLTQMELVNSAMSLMPQAKSITIPAAGHLVQFEKPYEINKSIKEFLK